jgi:D-aminopeptidase
LPVMADYAAVVPGVERIGSRTVAFGAPDGDRFYRLFVSLVRLAGVPAA